MTISPVQSPLELIGELLSFAGKQDPYPLYESMRALGNVVNVNDAMFFVSGYEECAWALRQNGILLSTDDNVQDKRLPGWREHSSWVWLTKNMLFNNAPRHDRMRQFFGRSFTARRVQSMRTMIERLAEDAVRNVERLGADGSAVDLVGDFSYRYAISVIGELLGVPPDDQAGMREDIGHITVALDPITDMDMLLPGDAAMDRLAAYFYDRIAQLRREPGEDLTSQWVAAVDSGSAEITEEELVANLMLLIVAATEAPQDLLSNTVRLAIEHPDYHERLLSEPSFVENFTDESLRFDPAAQVLNRVAAQDLDFFGHAVPQGASLTLLIAAANRDPMCFDEPNVFDPDRTKIQALTFSGGSHFCLGAAVARMSSNAVLPRLLRQFPALRLAAPPEFRDQIVQRGHSTLPVYTH